MDVGDEEPNAAPRGLVQISCTVHAEVAKSGRLWSSRLARGYSRLPSELAYSENPRKKQAEQ